MHLWFRYARIFLNYLGSMNVDSPRDYHFTNEFCKRNPRMISIVDETIWHGIIQPSFHTLVILIINVKVEWLLLRNEIVEMETIVTRSWLRKTWQDTISRSWIKMAINCMPFSQIGISVVSVCPVLLYFVFDMRNLCLFFVRRFQWWMITVRVLQVHR